MMGKEKRSTDDEDEDDELRKQRRGRVGKHWWDKGSIQGIRVTQRGRDLKMAHWLIFSSMRHHITTAWDYCYTVHIFHFQICHEYTSVYEGWRERPWSKVEAVNFQKTCYSDTLRQALMEHTDPVFVKVDVSDLQKVVQSSDDIIFTVKMVSTELLLHLEEKIIVWELHGAVGPHGKRSDRLAGVTGWNLWLTGLIWVVKVKRTACPTCIPLLGALEQSF